jgi:hypothetical protein
MAYFRNFRIADYSFGDDLPPALFQDLTVYIDLIDQVADNVSFYEYIDIKDGERPDTLSQKIYDTSEYHWMFYYLNDNIRQQGWPLTYQELLAARLVRYPNVVLTTEYEPIASGDAYSNFTLFAEQFTVGKAIRGENTGAQGIILERNLDLGQIVVQKTNTITFSATEYVQVNTGLDTRSAKLIGRVDQYDAVHHYEDTNGVWVDIDPFDQTTSTSNKIPITHFERMKQQNDDLKKIKVFTPDVANQVNSEYQKLLRLR